MKVKMNDIGGNILDIIQFAHRHNKDQYNFSIDFAADGSVKPTAYFSTISFEIMDAIAAEWPSATIITTK